MLARRVWPDGRTRAYVCGRAATQADLQELGGAMLSFYGQHEHRKLTLSSSQLDLLDAYCGDGAAGSLAEVRVAHGRVRELGRARRVAARAGGRPRPGARPDRFELSEIEAAGPEPASRRRWPPARPAPAP